MILGYVVTFGAIVFLFSKFSYLLTGKFYLYFIGVTLLFLLTILINFLVDGNTLNVDRWSAMDVAIEALLNDRYPYSAIDHLNGRTSNLPGLFILGLPFYLLGDVGYLQSATLLFLAFTLWKAPLLKAVLFKHHHFIRIAFIILMFSISTSYLWEVYVKSDLMSNFIIVLCCMLWIYPFFENRKKQRLLWIPALLAFLLLTRLNTVLILIVFSTNYFIKINARSRVVFVITFITMVCLLLWLAFYNYGSINNFEKFNPFVLQNRQSIMPLSALLVLSSVFVGIFTRSFNQKIIWVLIIMFTSVLIPFLINIQVNGWVASIHNSRYDLSYFNMALPFIILAMGIYLPLDGIRTINKVSSNNFKIDRTL